MGDPVTSTAALFKGTENVLKKVMPEMPEQPKPKIAPVADEAAKRAAAARAAQRKYAGTGRAGTMLSGEAEKLG